MYCQCFGWIFWLSLSSMGRPSRNGCFDGGHRQGPVYFVSLTARNVYTRKVRSSLTGIAIAISIAVVVTMGVLTHSLRRTAVSILRTGDADFSVAQKGVSDVIYSSVDEKDVELIRSYEGVDNAIGVLVDMTKLDEDHPFFLKLGIPPADLEGFGVQIVAGRKYEPDSQTEMIIGYRAARDLGKTVGDSITIDDDTYDIVGIYATGQVFADAASMTSLVGVQTEERKPGVVTLVFVRITEGADIDGLRSLIEHERPELATVRTESEFGRIDRNLELISAANIGVSALALIIGAVSILNTMVLSVFERTREFGVLRAIGWSRMRVLLCVMMEALVVSLSGAMVGVGAGFIAVEILARSPDLVGVFQPDYPGGVFGRALAIAFGMAFVGALYPAARAALLRPLDAIRHE